MLKRYDKLIGKQYVRILSSEVHPFMFWIHIDGSDFLQQNNVLPHKCCDVRLWLQEYLFKFAIFPFLPKFWTLSTNVLNVSWHPKTFEMPYNTLPNTLFEILDLRIHSNCVTLLRKYDVCYLWHVSKNSWSPFPVLLLHSYSSHDVTTKH